MAESTGWYDKKHRAQCDYRNRYADDWREMLAERYRPFLRERMAILDVGSGRLPAIPVEKRPRNCRYLGFDISSEELTLAPAGSYDEWLIRDIRVREPALDDQIDLVVSWQVLEHVEPLADAIDNIHAYLKPGGHFGALLTGRNAHFAVINRFVPQNVGVWAMANLLERPADTIFRAHYDSCTYSGLMRLMQAWTDVEVTPLYRGAGYLGFFKPAAKLYMMYENWAANTGKKNLATHYLISATR